MGLLKIAAPDFGRRDLRRYAEHRYSRPVAVEETIDQVQITWPTTAGADRKLTRQMRLRACRKGSNLLVPDMHPLDLALAADGVGQPVQAVPDNAVNPLDAGRCERLRELISDSFCHFCPPFTGDLGHFFFRPARASGVSPRQKHGPHLPSRQSEFGSGSVKRRKFAAATSVVLTAPWCLCLWPHDEQGARR